MDLLQPIGYIGRCDYSYDLSNHCRPLKGFNLRVVSCGARRLLFVRAFSSCSSLLLFFLQQVSREVLAGKCWIARHKIAADEPRPGISVLLESH